MVLESLIIWAILKLSWISSSGPVAMGFSRKIATPGKCLRICNSMSRPGCVDPRNIGGLPTMIARGRSRGAIFRTKSSNVLNTRVSWYADMTKESHFFWSTAVARSIAGSIRATTLRRRPSLLAPCSIGLQEIAWKEAYCSKRKEWFQGPSSDPGVLAS